MSGNKLSSLISAETNKRKYGADYYQIIGAMGGRVKTPKGFAIDNRTFMQKLLRRPTLAQRAGRLGGIISRKGKHGRTT